MHQPQALKDWTKDPELAESQDVLKAIFDHVDENLMKIDMDDIPDEALHEDEEMPDEGGPHGDQAFVQKTRTAIVRVNSSIDVGAAVKALQANSEISSFRRRYVEVNTLVEGDSLGLLLTGTTVASFSCPEAKLAGWHVGDHIVEVNGDFCENFSEFLKLFIKARTKDGFPIVFTVLRHESAHTVVDIDTVDPRHMLKGKATLEQVADGRETMLDNPYIKALRRRRTDSQLCVEGWNTLLSDRFDPSESLSVESLASRLATQRDGVASFTEVEGLDDGSVLERPNRRAVPCGEFILCAGDAGSREEPLVEVIPRISPFDSAYRGHNSAFSPCPSGRIKICRGDTISSPESADRDFHEPCILPESCFPEPCWSTRMELCSNTDFPTDFNDVKPSQWRARNKTSDSSLMVGLLHPEGYKLFKPGRQNTLDTVFENEESCEQGDRQLPLDKEPTDVSDASREVSLPHQSSQSTQAAPSKNFAMQLLPNWGPIG